MTSPQKALRAASGLSLTLAIGLLAGCGSGGEGAGSASTPTPGHADASSSTPPTAGKTEQKEAVPRLVATYEGGLLVLDATTLDVVADLPLAGYNRVNPVGDGRHVAVSTEGGFRILDAGTWERPHGDHSHHYTAQPAFTDVTVPAGEPGHVVVHGGTTAFFDDATGRTTLYPSGEVATPGARPRTLESEHAHHGVAVAEKDGTVVSTLGDEKKRTGVYARDAHGHETARDERCPGVHGEAMAQGALVFGCQDGILVYDGTAFHKIQAPDAYGRIGNQAGDENSPIVLGDYKVDKDAKLECPRRVTLVDTRAKSLRLVDLPASYSFRSLGRGPAGEALVLGTDGKLHVVDEEAGTLSRSIPVVTPWEESEDWHDPRPTLRVAGDLAYVSEPATKKLVVVDLRSGEKVTEKQLPHATDELAFVSGKAAGE